MKNPSNDPPPCPADDAAFGSILKDRLSAPPQELTPDRRDAILRAFETVATRPKKAHHAFSGITPWIGAAAAAAIMMGLARPDHPTPSPPTAPTANTPAIHSSSARPANAPSALDLTNYNMAVMNSQLAALEHRIAWLNATAESNSGKSR